MNSYTIDTVLDTREPGVIELFGNAPGVVHKVSGVVNLHVEKTIHLKEISVVFVCEAVVGYRSTVISTSSDPMTIYKNQFDAISSSTEYIPGDYTFPFQLAIPSDLSTTDSTKLISQEFIWMYHLTTTAVPAHITRGTTITSLFQKRKTIQQPLVLRKIVVDPSGGNSTRFNAKREGPAGEGGDFRMVIYVPQVVNVRQSIVPIKVLMKASDGNGNGRIGTDRKGRFLVKEIQAQMIQTEKIIHNSPEAYESMEGLRRTIPIGIQDDPMALKKHRKPSSPNNNNPSNTTTNANVNTDGRTNTTSFIGSILRSNSSSRSQSNQPSQTTQTTQTTLNPQSPQNISASIGSLINTTHTRNISNLATIVSPNQFVESTHDTEGEFSQLLELDLTAGDQIVNAGGEQCEVLPSETLPWVTISHAVRIKVVFEQDDEKPLVVKAPIQLAYILERENLHLLTGRPVAQGPRINIESGDDWMFGESAPDYDADGRGNQQVEEDVLPGYGEDVSRSSLLDSNLRSNQQGVQVK
ncbi:hypothetical protein FBU30_010245 [Linnemannia zychae]|nr:hypothetical protein FBU30_010245 [Linnemannia zychae]